MRLNFASAAYKAIKLPEVLLYCLFPGKLGRGTRRCSEDPGAGLPQQHRLSLTLHDLPEIGHQTLLLTQVEQGATHCWVPEQVSRLSLMDPLLVISN